LLTVGTFALASGVLGREFNNDFFRVVTCVVTVVVVLFWMLVMTMSVVWLVKDRTRVEEASRLEDGYMSKEASSGKESMD
jgi:SNF family Na+-dependent transporter